jgi:hypothetical protein
MLYCIPVRELDGQNHLGDPDVERRCNIVDWILLAQDGNHCKCPQVREMNL